MKLKFHFELQPIAGMYVAVATGKDSEKFSGVIRLNESGSKIFSFIQDGLDDDQIVEEMLKIYEANPSDIRKDVSAIKNMLIEKGLSAD